jgi:hypothetical protein
MGAIVSVEQWVGAIVSVADLMGGCNDNVK